MTRSHYLVHAALAVFVAGCVSSTPAPCTEHDAVLAAILAECEVRIPAECTGAETCPAAEECRQLIRARCAP